MEADSVSRGDVVRSIRVWDVASRLGSACLPPDAALTRAFTGTALTFAMDGNDYKAAFQGTLNGDTLSGTMTVQCAAGPGVGTWTATRK